MSKYKILSIPLFLIGFLFSVAILNNNAFAGSATLNWNANTEPDLAGYRIYYGTSSRTGTCPPGGYANNLSVGNVTSYIFNSLADGQTWYFSVAAYDTSNNVSCFSAEVSKVLPAVGDTTPPTIPTNLSATAISSSQINLSWTASTDNIAVVGYEIFRGGTRIATTTLTAYSDIGLSASTAYSYTVRAYDAAGNFSAQSTAATATTQSGIDTTPPSNISNISVSNTSLTSLQLNWTAPGNDGNAGTAASYDIRYSTSTITLSNWPSATQITGEPIPVVAGTAQLMAISGLTANTTYYFAIRTTDPAGNVSGLSNIASVTTQSYSLSVSVSATPSSGTGSLSNVSLTASVSGSQVGNINYTFYCNRSDSGTNVTTPYDGKYNNQTLTTYTATNLCSYSTPGTYTAKVIAERGMLQAQNTASVVIVSNPTPTPTPTPMPTNGVGATIDTTPPSVPSNTKISMSGNQVVITWSNPTDSDFRGITIIRKQGSSPTSRTDGNIVYNNNLQNFIDSVDSSKTFYYAVYSYDNNNNYTQPVILKAEPGQTSVISQPAPTVQQPQQTQQSQPSVSVLITIPSTIPSGFEFTQYLTVGKSGDEVKHLQEVLAANPIIYPEGTVTGYYGSATQRAIQRFQEMYGVTNYSNSGYGDVGPSTRLRLNQLLSYKQTSSATSTTLNAEQSRQALIAKLKALIAQIEAQILTLLEQLKKIKAGQQ